jgi:adenylosuccinate synthase
MKLSKGVNIIIDGQFGSTGKGLIAGYIGATSRLDLAVSNAGPNAGHTYYTKGGEKLLAYHLPLAGVVNDQEPDIYVCAGAIINPVLLGEELASFAEWGVEKRLFIHPRAAVVEPKDIEYEAPDHSSQTILASTRKGVGRSLARKVMREARLAGEHPNLKKYTSHSVQNFVEMYADSATVLMEVPQGMDLSLNHGLAYPYCTSREVCPAQAMSDLGVHPSKMGDVIMSLRTLPIRVGNIYNEAGEEIGNSGPCWPDQTELKWESIGVEPELTTVTKRPRRIFSFSEQQAIIAIRRARPNRFFLNFCNYISRQQVDKILQFLLYVANKEGITVKSIHTGWGPLHNDIREEYNIVEAMA